MLAHPILTRRRFFYGWVIVAVAFLGDLVAAGIGFYGFGVFLKPMSQEFGWTRAMTAGALTFRSIISGLTAPLVGTLVDRRGPRLIMTVGGALGGLGFVLLSRMSELWHLYLVYGLLGAVGMIGVGGLVSNSTIAKWFIQKRGRAIAIATTGLSLGGVVFTPLTERLIALLGWRGAWVILGIIAWALVIPTSAAFMRRRPEDVGLLPDGLDQASSGKEPSKSITVQLKQKVFVERTWTLQEALHTRALWLIVLAFNMAGLSAAAIPFHHVAYVTDRGFTSTQAALSLTVFAFCAAVAKLIWGFVAERIHMRYCVMGVYLGSALALLLLLNARSIETIFAFSVLFGLSFGGQVVLNPLTWANYYGRDFLGTILGVVQPFTMIASAVGPLFAGYVYDVTKSYQRAFFTFLLGFLLGAGFMYLAKPPSKRNQLTHSHVATE